LLTDPLFLAAAAIAVILLGLAKGGFAGVGTLSTPLLALVIAPGDAAGILLPILLVSDVISVWSYRKTWDARNLKVMMPASAVGIAVGWWLAAYFTPAYIRISIGAIAIAFGLFNLVGLAGRRKVERSSPVKGAFWASIAGFTSFVSHAGGPPFQIHLMPQKLPHQVFVGTSTIYFAWTNFLKIVPYALLGQLSAKNITISLAFLPLAIATTLAGVWLIRRTPHERFYKIVYALMLVVGVELLREGWLGIFGAAGAH
jgi:uncharacterized membrane protein YfcA